MIRVSLRERRHHRAVVRMAPVCVVAVAAALSFTSACASDTLGGSPAVQASTAAQPRWIVDLNRVVDGVFRTYRPRCFDTVRVGHTVEFRNFNPEIPADVTSIASPQPLYSPTLRRPYNYVGADAPENKLCDEVAADGRCSQRPAYSYWRTTFEVPGVYDWIDTHSGEPGRKVVDPYYGTVTFVGIDPNTPFGTVCVLDETSGGCENVCCSTHADCSGGTRCMRSEIDSVGRCLTPSG